MMLVVKICLITALYALFGAGCAADLPKQPISRFPDAGDMLPCPELEKPADGTLAGLFRYGVAAAHRYNECRAHHDNLIGWVNRGGQ